jgi:hypothetical protein
LTLEAVTRIEIPRRLRALVRARESSLVGLAAVVGAIAGVVVAVMGDTVDMLHEIFFRLAPGERLSGRLVLDPWLAVAVPVLGGILFGLGAGSGDRSDRSECAARRPDVAARQLYRRCADGVVERCRRFRRA